ncbi:MAG: BTAD domain-containing putative transcriptional regulator [Actinomycetota bacterium]
MPAPIEVQVFGPVRVIGAARPLDRAYTLDLVTHLVLHRDGVSTDQWVTALWPDRLMAPATIHSTSSAARRSLGIDANGRDHLPHGHRRLKVASTVQCDLDRLESTLNADLAVRLEAVQQLRGRPFEGLRRFDWVLAEGHMTKACDVASALTLSVAEELLLLDHPSPVLPILRKGLSVNPFDEALWRALLEATFASGNVAGLDLVMVELGAVLGAMVGAPNHVVLEEVADMVHPMTWDRYKTLRSFRRARQD